MSLDVYLKDVDGSYVFEYNITHNLAKMASSAGLYEVLWDALDQGYTCAEQLITKLEQGIIELVCNENQYKKLNPENGWGTYEGLLRFAGKYLKACKQYPNALIEVSR